MWKKHRKHILNRERLKAFSLRMRHSCLGTHVRIKDFKIKKKKKNETNMPAFATSLWHSTGSSSERN